MPSVRYLVQLILFIFPLCACLRPITKGTAFKLVEQLQGRKNPLIVYINANSLSSDYRNDFEIDESQEDTNYWLKYLLRSKTDEDDGDITDFDVAEDETNESLRQALRIRVTCTKLNSCFKKCPQKKFTCQSTCKEVIDEEDICPRPKKRKKWCNGCSSWGKTLPPDFALR